MKEKILKVLKIIFIVILFIILAVNTVIFIQTKTEPDKVPNLFGYKPFIVMSGSMETNIHVGDVVIVKEIDPTTLEVGDVIAFRSSKSNKDEVTTHRIINKTSLSNDVCFNTKGDNNNVQDKNIVCSKDVEGKYQMRIPKIGDALLFIQEPLGFTIMMMTIFIICILWYFIENKKIDAESAAIDEKEMKEFEEFKEFQRKKQLEKAKQKKEQEEEKL